MTTEGNSQTPTSDQAGANRRKQQGEPLGDLGTVLERLWIFYEAMRKGMPVQNADAALAQLGTALRNGAQRVHRPGSLPVEPVADPRDAEAF
jgi:hypothetical protein